MEQWIGNCEGFIIPMFEGRTRMAAFGIAARYVRDKNNLQVPLRDIQDNVKLWKIPNPSPDPKRFEEFKKYHLEVHAPLARKSFPEMRKYVVNFALQRGNVELFRFFPPYHQEREALHLCRQ